MKKPLIILYFSLLVVMTGYGVTLPVLPFSIERLALAEGATAAEAALQVGVLTGIFALMQFFFAPVWGRWSDELGRRPLFLIGLGGYGVFMVLFGMGTNLVVLYSARILGGILSAALLPVASAYVADETSEEERGRGMAWLGSAVGLGIVIGPALGALFSRLDSHQIYRFRAFNIDTFSLPFFAAALLSFLALSAAMVWLPESFKPPGEGLQGQGVLPENSRKRESDGWFIPRWLMPFLLLAFLNQFALALFEGTFALHGSRVMQFGPPEMSLVFVVCGFVMAAAQALVVVWLVGRLGERTLLQTGFALMGVGLTMLMTTRNMSFIVSYVAILAFGVALIIPSLATLVSKHAGKRPGAALGQLISANNLGQAGGPAVGGFLFVWQIHAPYLLTALLLFSASVYITITKPFGPD